MSDTRTPDDIERELEENREGLRSSIAALQDTFSPETIFRSVTDNVGRHGGDFGKSIGAAARENPLALAVTGVGLGWLIFGRGPSADSIERSARRAGDSDLTLGGKRRTAYGEGADASIGPRGPVPEGDAPNWMSDENRGPTMGQRARASWHNAGSRMRSAGTGASDTAGRVRDRSNDMGRRLSEGTEHMGEEARERIVAAREQAVIASERASQSMSRGADRAVDFFEEHPIVAGALAFAVGAAIAGGLPRSRYEDEHFGAESDRLYGEAERVFAEERAKAERVAGAALDEARTVGDEVRKDAESAKDRADSETQGEGSATDAAVDRTEDAARRVADAAGAKAREENFGPSRG